MKHVCAAVIRPSHWSYIAQKQILELQDTEPSTWFWICYFKVKKITLWCFMWQLATSFLASCQKHGWIIRTWYCIWGGALLKLLGGSCSQKRAKFIYFCVIPNVIGPNNYPSIVSQPLQCILWHCSYQLWPLGKVGFKVGLLSWRLQLHSALHVRRCRDGDRQAGL